MKNSMYMDFMKQILQKFVLFGIKVVNITVVDPNQIIVVVLKRPVHTSCTT